MQVQLRKRLGLLSRVSTLAIIAAASGGLGAVQQAQAAACSGATADVTTPTTLTGTYECVRVNTLVDGDIKNQAVVGSPDPGPGYSPFFIGKGGIVDGQVWNDASISGGYGGEGSSGLGALTIAEGGQILGGILNTGQILSNNNGIQIGTTSGGETSSSGTVQGGITNNAAISGVNNGVAALSGDFSDGLINNANGVITGGNGAGIYIADTFNDWSGGITNSGTLKSTNGPGIQIGAPGSSNVDFSGGIHNDTDGEISSVNGAAIFAGGNSFSGGLLNEGLITQTGSLFSGKHGGAGIVFDAQSVSGDINNSGTIVGVFRQGIFVTDNVGILNSSVMNSNLIDGAEGGVIVRADAVNGNFSNPGLIFGGERAGVSYVVDDTIFGPGGEGATATFDNSGSILGGTHGFEVWADTVNMNFSTGGGEGLGVITGSSGVGVLLNANSWNGNVTNTGTVNGGEIGVAMNYDPFFGKGLPGSEFNGDFQNSGVITGGSTGVRVGAYAYDGNFTNDGTIIGGNYGAALVGASSSSVVIFALGGGSFTGDITNTGVMSGNTALLVSYENVTGDVSNSAAGVLLGVSRGLYIDVESFDGDITNSGTIVAPGGTFGSFATAIQIGDPTLVEGDFPYSEQVVTGSITNAGTAHGGDTGLAIVLNEYFAGKDGPGFTNSGTIIGDNRTGMYVNVNGWNGDFTNSAGGYIYGGNDGVFFNAGTIVGDFTNNGTIVGGSTDTGWSINTPSFTGNISNGVSGLITAPSNALHLTINSFTGQISNAGLIASPSGNAAVLEGYNTSGTYNGAFTNTGSIVASNIGLYLNNAQLTGGIDNNGGSIVAPIAISTEFASGATTITNEGDGVLIGDVRFSNTYGDSFIGHNGGIVGSLVGSGGEGGEGGGNDDTVLVHNGEHYFAGKGEQANDLESFTVGKNGMAIMGALFEGDTNGSGYFTSNIDSIAVQNGGVLYIDKSTTMNGDSYTQSGGGTLEFYLQAPGGEGFSSLTGDQVAAAGDYGQVLVTGTATLDGTIAAFLDPEFANANSDLESVTYNDVLVADGGITGDFSTLALISNNTIFELEQVLDGNTIDLTVLRVADVGQLPDVGSIIINLGGPFTKIVNEHSAGVGGGGCGVAGAGWCLNSYAANEPGGSAVMTDASLDPFQWLRGGQRRVGDTNVWARAVGVWGDTDGDNAGHPGTEFDTFGGIAGIDHVFTPIFMAGAAAQYTQTDIDFTALADNADVNSFEIGAYMSYGDARFYLNANSSVIFHSIEVERFAVGGTANGDYDGTTYSVYGEIGRIFETEGGAVRIQPLAALSYAHLDTDSYNETGSATTLLHVFDAELDSLKSMLGARFGFPIAMDSGRKFVPEVRAIWAHEFMDDQASFLANPITPAPGPVARITGERYSRDALIVGTGATLPLSDATSIFVDYDASLNSDITTHTVSGGFRSRW